MKHCSSRHPLPFRGEPALPPSLSQHRVCYSVTSANRRTTAPANWTAWEQDATSFLLASVISSCLSEVTSSGQFSSVSPSECCCLLTAVPRRCGHITARNGVEASRVRHAGKKTRFPWFHIGQPSKHLFWPNPNIVAGANSTNVKCQSMVTYKLDWSFDQNQSLLLGANQPMWLLSTVNDTWSIDPNVNQWWHINWIDLLTKPNHCCLEQIKQCDFSQQWHMTGDLWIQMSVNGDL